MSGERTPQQIVNDLRIASPCEMPWSAMDGDDRTRHCGQCDRKVYNVARLSADEVVALLQASDRPPCLQLWRRADGTVLTTDCPIGARRLRNRRRAPLAMTLTALLAACGGLRAQGHKLVPRTTGLTGDVVFSAPCPKTAGESAPKQRLHRTSGKVAPRAQPPLMGAPPPKAEKPTEP
jgi:hypothetical protein